MSKKPDDILIRPPYTKYPHTNQELREIALASDPITGPHYFLNNFFQVQHPTKGKMSYHPYPYQVDLIDTFHNYRYSINLLSRQIGKCLGGDSSWINIRNKQTGKKYELPIRLLYELQSAKVNNMPLPDISKYEK